MIYKISIIHHDTCGNVWTEDRDPVLYREAPDIVAQWQKMGCPKIMTYRLNGVDIFMHRTASQGEGSWEPNPQFNPARDLRAATKFCFGAFSETHVEQLVIG
jgi:hypothetical protein